MSEIKVNSIKGVGASSAAITVDNTNGTCTLASGSKLNNCTTDGTTNLTIADGNLVFSTNGHGIDFSATADGSGTDSSELLDDYEEGTWTPTVTGGTISNSGAYYTKIGRAVHWYLYGYVSNTENDGAQFRIYGLRYNLGGNYTGLNNYYGNVASFNYTQSANNTGITNLGILTHGAQNYIYFHFVGTGDSNPPVNSFFHSHLLNQGFIISGVYFV